MKKYIKGFNESNESNGSNLLSNDLRNKAENFRDKTVTFTGDANKYGFLKGDFNLAELLEYLADMIEE